MSVYFSLLNDTSNLQRAIDRMFSGYAWPEMERGALPAPADPEIRYGRDDKNLYVEVEAPGIDPKSLEVTIENNVLRVSASKPAEVEDEGVIRWHRRERRGRAFNHQFRLPADVDRDKISADYKHGLLFITIPRKEAAQPKQIQVQVK